MNDEDIIWSPGATEYEWTSPYKQGLVKFKAVQHPIPDMLRLQLIDAGLSKDHASIRRIERFLRSAGPTVVRRVRPTPLPPPATR
jgi:hypothetical protein